MKSFKFYKDYDCPPEQKTKILLRNLVIGIGMMIVAGFFIVFAVLAL